VCVRPEALDLNIKLGVLPEILFMFGNGPLLDAQ